MNSEEQVQVEGVEALLKVSTDYLSPDDAQFLVFNIVQIIMNKSDQSETAKIAVLLIVEKFSEANIFKEKQCLAFLNQYLPELSKGMLFKIKKFLLPALISLSSHIPYETYINIIYPTFIKFSQDDIWGVRKVCVEKLQDIIKLIDFADKGKIQQCLLFL